MRHRRHLAAAVLAGPMALALVAASTPEGGPHGTATTSLSAVELAITTPVGDGAIDLVDLSTFASTAEAVAVNPKGAPFASALLVPITGPTGPLGRTEARSDGQTSARSGDTVLGDVGGPLADLTAAVNPATLTATASADEARAAVESLTATIAGLADAIGVSVDATGVVSHVTADRASALQGLRVSELELTLGDILPQDVLASLPLPDLLAFLETLPIELPTQVQQLIDRIQQVVSELLEQLEAVTTTAAAAESTAAELEDALEALETLQQLLALESQLALLDPDDATIEDSLEEIGGTVGTITDTITGTIGGAIGDTTGGLLTTSGLRTLASSDDCNVEAISALDSAEEIAALTTCVESLIDETLATFDVASVEELEALIDELIEELTTIVTTLVELIDGLERILGTLTTAIAGLDDLLGSLDGLLADAAGTPLVGVSAFDIGLNAVSDGTLEGSSATLLCQPVTVTILTRTVSTPSCEEGLSAVSDATALVNGLLGTLTETLNVLPLTEVLTTGDLTVDLFSNVQRSVEQQGDAVVATAGFDVLDLQVPSITIDPGAVTGLLGQLGLPDVLGTVQGLLADLQAQVQALGLPELATVTGTLTTATSELGAAGGLEDLTDQLNAIIAGLDLGDIGTLDRISTPGVSLVIDPVSTASFTLGSSASSTPPVGAPAPAPATPTTPSAPSLPNTGGGLALLGVLTLAGASALRRRS